MRWLRRAGQVLLHVDQSPTRVAAAFGLGVFIAFFPLLGVHTLVALLLAVALRLSKVAILVGAWTNNPWTIAPMLTAGTMLGCLVLGVSPASLGAIDWSLRGRAFYESLAAGFAPLLWPYVVGNLLLGVLAGLLGFGVVRSVLASRRAAPAAGSGSIRR
jgi:uncharacterized protein (DUF2062 family)